MLKIWKYIFGDWNKWQDVSCTESLGWIGIVQTRTEKRTGKRQIRKKKIWVNDYSKISEIKANMFRG
jgi:hypothetical protein